MVATPTHLVLDIVAEEMPTTKKLEGFVRDVANSLELNIVQREDGSEVIESLGFYNTEGEFGDGNSCLALLIESNIAVHTREEGQLINIDIFSCKEFAWWEMIGKCRKWFGVAKVNQLKVLER